MTDSEKLTLLKTMVNVKDEEILNAYLFLAGQKILLRAYPFDRTVSDVPACYAGHQIAIAAYLINKRGAEGETAHSENGVSQSYENADVPASMMRDITPMVGVIKRK